MACEEYNRLIAVERPLRQVRGLFELHSISRCRGRRYRFQAPHPHRQPTAAGRCRCWSTAASFRARRNGASATGRICPFPPNTIDAVILTHAHLDHSGWIPRLVKQGFHGPIYATAATIDLCGILLPDSGHLQEEDAEFYNKTHASKHHPALPLYTMEEAQQCMTLFRPVEFGKSSNSAAQFSFRFVRAAHILGSSMAEITVADDGKTKKLLFTGDIGRVRDSEIAPGKVVHPGPTEGEDCDLLVMESTYGNRAASAQRSAAGDGGAHSHCAAARRQRGGAVIRGGAHAEVSVPVEGADGDRPDSARAGACRQPDGDQGSADLPEAHGGVHAANQGADREVRLAAGVAEFLFRRDAGRFEEDQRDRSIR